MEAFDIVDDTPPLSDGYLSFKSLLILFKALQFELICLCNSNFFPLIS